MSNPTGRGWLIRRTGSALTGRLARVLVGNTEPGQAGLREEQRMAWERLASTDGWEPNQGREFTVGDRIIAVFRSEQGFFALDGMCAHAGGPLAKGTVCGTIVTCPWHGWQYDISTGSHCLNGAIRQTCYPLKMEGDDLFVEIP